MPISTSAGPALSLDFHSCVAIVTPAISGTSTSVGGYAKGSYKESPVMATRHYCGRHLQVGGL